MDKSNSVVVFYPYNAKVFKVVGDVEKYKNKKNILVNPDFSKVKGHPPHHWDIQNGNLSVISDGEKDFRNFWHSRNIQKNPESLDDFKLESINKPNYILRMAIFTLLGYFLWKVL